MRLRTVLACSLALPAIAWAQNPGDCLVQDAAFANGGGGCQDLASNLAWSALAPGSWSWGPATQLCQNLVEGGFSDWRLPTKDELLAAYAHGAYTHLAIIPGHYSFWSSNVKGNKAWSVFLDTGQAGLCLKGMWPNGCALSVLCVRGSGPSSAGAGSGPGLTATHVVQDGRWSVLVHAPEHAHRRYLLIAGVGGEDPRQWINATVVTNTPRVANAGFDAGNGRFDAAGGATLHIELGGAGLDTEYATRLRLAVVVLDEAQSALVTYPLTPPSAPASTPPASSAPAPAAQAERETEFAALQVERGVTRAPTDG